MHLSEAGLGFLAGALSTLAPCVLPLIPIVVATATQANRWGPVALALGLTLSFTVVGLLVATLGVSSGLDAETLRIVSACILGLFGIVMLVPWLETRFSYLMERIASYGKTALPAVRGNGLGGQFAVGVLLGGAWSPCVGPTLGAAITLASSSHDLGRAAVVMLSFGLGASLPLLLIGSISAATVKRLRGRLAQSAVIGQKILGALFVLTALAALSGYDHVLESRLVALSPDWLTQLTSHF